MAPPALKTSQLADALGVGVSSIKRWVDAGELLASRTVGRHRLIEPAEAVRFALSRGLPTKDLHAPCQLPTVEPWSADRLADALRGGRPAEARRVIASAFGEVGAVVLADDVIRPAMEQIGHGWVTGEVEIYREHQATGVVTAALVDLIGRLPRPVEFEAAPLAIGAGPPGDLFSLAIDLGELVLRDLGWEVLNFGPNLPMDSLARAVKTHRPRLIFLSASHLAKPSSFRRDYAGLASAASSVGAAIILGGRALGADLRAELVYASFGERMAHLAEFARQLTPKASTSTRPDAPPAADPIRTP